MINMKITDPNSISSTTASVPTEQWAIDTSILGHETELLTEHSITVFVNEIPTFHISCSPSQLSEMVLGRLLSEGIISSADDVDILHLCEEGFRAKVFLNRQISLNNSSVLPEEVSTCCTDNITLSHIAVPRDSLQPVTPILFENDWIIQAGELMRSQLPMYSKTHSAHSCILIRNGEIMTVGEDIGRHNAMDKVIGWGLRNGVNLRECILFTSGRIPMDMTRKAIRAGIPVLASKSSPTLQSVELSRLYRLTLIGNVYSDSMKIFVKAD